MMNKKALILLVGSSVLFGCSSAPDAESIAKSEANAQKVRNEQLLEQRQLEQKALEEKISDMPSWVITPPNPDQTGVYGVGVGESKKIDIALKKSNLNAQFEVAKALKQELSGSEQNYTQDSDTGITEQYTQLIDNLIVDVPVVGYKTIERKVVAHGNAVTVYTLVKMPYAEFNDVIAKEAKQSQSEEIKLAFKELRERIKDKKLQAE